MSVSKYTMEDGFALPELGRTGSHLSSGASPDLDGEKKGSSGVIVRDVEAEEEDGGNAEMLEPEAIVVEGAEGVANLVIDLQDDPDLPCLTIRFWTLGPGLAAFGSVLSEIYYWKPQGATVSALFQLIISYVLGTAMAAAMPRVKIFGISLNPGKFNIKEHALIVIASSTASSTATAISCIAVLDLYYNLTLNPGIAIIQTWASQCLGYAFSGLLQVSAVYPTYALWPASIPSVSLLQSMHFGGLLNKKKMRYFWIVFTAIFCWEIVPTWMFPLLTAISIICMVDNGNSKHSAVLRNIFGAGSSNEGLGLFSFSLDWTLITQAYPLYWPLETQVNAWIGMALCYALMIGGYYSNVGDAYVNGIPFMSTDIFQANGSSYDQSLILTAAGELNQTAYEIYGRPYFSATYALSTVISNCSTGAAVTHVLLWHWKDIVNAFKSVRHFNTDDIDDAHFQAMQRYKTIPHWWYGVCYVVSLAIAMGTSYYGGTVQLPAWSILLFSIFGFFFSCILGILTAVTGFNPTTEGLIELIAAYLHPGHPIANMYAKLYGYSSTYQCLGLLQDQKLGQYVKLPPRTVLVAQGVGTILGATLNYIIYQSIVKAHRAILLDPLGSRIWAGWNVQSFNSSALTWGALAKELYVAGAPYWWIPAGLGFGLLIPIPFFVLSKLYPRVKIFRYLNFPVICTYMGWLPYSVNGMWWSGFVIGMASQWWARTRRPRWFIKYNYLTSAALDGGSSIIYFILNFAIFGAAGSTVSFPYWWGNADPDLLSVDRCMAPS